MVSRLYVQLPIRVMTAAWPAVLALLIALTRVVPRQSERMACFTLATGGLASCGGSQLSPNRATTPSPLAVKCSLVARLAARLERQIKDDRTDIKTS